MKYDVIIIGGGLSALTAGIKLQKSGKKCLIVSSGQNAMHFSSGSFGLLSKLPSGEEVEEPLKDMEKLPSEHPYKKIGLVKIREYLMQTTLFFDSCGVGLKGNFEKNSYMFTPIGNIKPCWLALDDISIFTSKEEKIGDKALIINIAGYMDFNTALIAEAMEKKGIKCNIKTIRLDELESVRQNPSEMRSVNIARVLDSLSATMQFAEQVNSMIEKEDIVVLPSVFGLKTYESINILKEVIKTKVMFIGTMPPSVPGMRSQISLKSTFESLGGIFMMGDEVVSAHCEGGKVEYIKTANLGELHIQADSFILATGGLFGKGLISTPEKVYEPVFDTDIEYEVDRSNWYDEDFFAKQNFTGFGVKTDNDFHPYKNGKIISNMYVIGAEVGGANPLYEGSGAGIAIMTAFKAAEQILG